MKDRYLRCVNSRSVDALDSIDEEFAPIIDEVAERNARRRRVAIRLAARFKLSYEDGARKRDDVLREAIAQTMGTKANENEVAWENIIPGKQGTLYEGT